LLERVKDLADRESWEEFYNLYRGRVYRFALQRGMTPHAADDIVQETFIYLTKKMPNFRYDSSRGKFRSWLLHLADWRIKDEKRRRRPDVLHEMRDDTRTTAFVDRIPDTTLDADMEARIELEWRQAVHEAAVSRVKDRVNPKQFQAYDFSVVKGWPAAKVAQALGISAALVHLWKYRVSKLIEKEVKALDTDKI
jgi:RNA polymerase sigma-70 factor (ECF subfamily)